MKSPSCALQKVNNLWWLNYWKTSKEKVFQCFAQLFKHHKAPECSTDSSRGHILLCAAVLLWKARVLPHPGPLVRNARGKVLLLIRHAGLTAQGLRSVWLYAPSSFSIVFFSLNTFCRLARPCLLGHSANVAASISPEGRCSWYWKGALTLYPSFRQQDCGSNQLWICC